MGVLIILFSLCDPVSFLYEVTYVIDSHSLLWTVENVRY